jgi:hypothetical protein
MSERRELFQPILLSIVIPSWAFDEAQSRTQRWPALAQRRCLRGHRIERLNQGLARKDCRMIHTLHTLTRIYWAIWLVCLFGAVCFSAGVATATGMAVAMLRVAG